MNAKVDIKNLTQAQLGPDQVMVSKSHLEALIALCNEMEGAFIELSVLFSSIQKTSECYRAQTLGDLGAIRANHWQEQWAEEVLSPRVHFSNVLNKA